VEDDNFEESETIGKIDTGDESTDMFGCGSCTEIVGNVKENVVMESSSEKGFETVGEIDTNMEEENKYSRNLSDREDIRSTKLNIVNNIDNKD
jgi:hypothetical protein